MRAHLTLTFIDFDISRNLLCYAYSMGKGGQVAGVAAKNTLQKYYLEYIVLFLV